MSDPTFMQQFGMAVQADILRQAAIDRQDWRARRHGQRRGSIWLRTLLRHLIPSFRLVPAHRRNCTALPADWPDLLQ